MKSIAGCVAAVLMLWCFSVSANAGAIVNLMLVPDGSADPPGDRIDVSLLFGPEETKVTCEVCAFILGEGKHDTHAVESRNKAHADKSGFFLVTQPVSRGDGGKQRRSSNYLSSFFSRESTFSPQADGDLK